MAWLGSFIAALFISNFSKLIKLWSTNTEEEPELGTPDGSDQSSTSSDESEPEPYALVNRELYSTLVVRPGVNALDQHVANVPTCVCELNAQRRVSKTRRNMLRPFYNCPKPDFADQCGYFMWEDELLDQESIESGGAVCNVCLQLRRRITTMEDATNYDRALWEREKLELLAELLSVKCELDGIKRRIELANEADDMPPFDKLSISEDGVGDEVIKAIVVQT